MPTKNDVSVIKRPVINRHDAGTRTPTAFCFLLNIVLFVSTVGLVQSNHVRKVLSPNGVLRRRLDISVTDRYRIVDQFYVPCKNHAGKSPKFVRRVHSLFRLDVCTTFGVYNHHDHVDQSIVAILVGGVAISIVNRDRRDFWKLRERNFRTGCTSRDMFHCGSRIPSRQVLIIKLRSANSAETHNYKKATKALLVLIPLLGITFCLDMINPSSTGLLVNIYKFTKVVIISTQVLVTDRTNVIGPRLLLANRIIQGRGPRQRVKYPKSRIHFE